MNITVCQCGGIVPVTQTHNGLAYVWHGNCPVCGWANDTTAPRKATASESDLYERQCDQRPTDRPIGGGGGA